MSHLLIFLHFISFTTGIGLIALIYYFNNRYKNKTARCVILVDIFYTFVLFMDTLDLYFRKNFEYYPISIHKSITILLYIFSIVGLYFFSLTIHYITDNQLSKSKMVFFVFLFLIFVGGVVWELFYTFSLISISITAKFVIFTLNIILIINLLLIFRGIDKIKKELKPLVLSCSIFILFSILYSFLINIFNNLPLFFYKVPISPVVYFYVNLAGIIYVKKYIFAMNENEKQVNDIVACYDYIKLYDFNKLAISYELTERELEIVRHIVDGLSNQDIAKRLFISPNTVKNHIYNTYKKIGIKNRFELISLLSKMKSESKLNNQI